MNRNITLLIAAFITMAAHSTVFRVSNIPGGSATYTTIGETHDAAEDGDTIMVDGSETSYGKVTIKKPLVLIGPGYLLLENSIISEAAPNAKAYFTIEATASGTKIVGFHLSDGINGGLNISAANCVITKCYFDCGSQAIRLYSDNCVFHQNYFYNCGALCTTGGDYYYVRPFQFTNNIVKTDGSHNVITRLANGYIAYNTIVPKVIRSDNKYNLWSNVRNSTFEHNIMPTDTVTYSNIHIANNNEYADNYLGYFDTNLDALVTDRDIQTAELAMSGGAYGAFAGESPYVISGIPAAPIIEDLTMPASVQKGDIMSITIKIGIQK